MAAEERENRVTWVWYLLLILFLLKVIVYLFWHGSFLFWSATWFTYLWVIIGFAIIWQLRMVLILSTQSWMWFIKWVIGWLVIIFIVGFSTHALRWTGQIHFKGSASSTSNAQVVGTTSWGENIIPCETTASTPIASLPAGVTMRMSSSAYTMSNDPKYPSYDTESTSFVVPAISLAKINTASKDSYTAAELPEGDVFFRVEGEIGFAAGYDFDMQVCSTDGRMLKKETLGEPNIRSAEDAANVTAITQYLWHNKRVWEPGTYEAYGYFYSDGAWHLAARSPAFTITP